VPATPSSPLNVLVLATTFPAEPGDGTPEFVLTLSTALAREGANVTVLVPRVRGAAAEQTIENVRVRRFAYFPRRWEDLADDAIMPRLRMCPHRWLQVLPLLVAFHLAAFRAVRRERPDVVHAHWIVPAGIVARVLHLLTGTPYIVTAHGADAYTLRSAPALRLKRSIMHGARATMPVSGAIGAELGALGRVNPAIPMGVDFARVRDEVGERKAEPGRVLLIGRLVDKKGVNVVLDAAAEVDAARIVIAGDGPLGRDLRAQARSLGISDRVEFLGHRTRRQVMAELARAAIVVIPSQIGADGDQDGVPVVLGEAIAAGVPVVASDLGGLAEHVIDKMTGRLVRPGSSSDLACAVRELLADPAQAEELAAMALRKTAGALDLAHIEQHYARELAAAARA
jgi:colanic acid/amylovoran biosynthesis glycosyltransferase